MTYLMVDLFISQDWQRRQSWEFYSFPFFSATSASNEAMYPQFKQRLQYTAIPGPPMDPLWIYLSNTDIARFPKAYRSGEKVIPVTYIPFRKFL